VRTHDTVERHWRGCAGR